jgi:hypothetical protein
VEANILGVGGRERGERGQEAMVMIRMVDLIVVRSLNAARAKLASVKIIGEFRALMRERDRSRPTRCQG